MSRFDTISIFEQVSVRFFAPSGTFVRFCTRAPRRVAVDQHLAGNHDFVSSAPGALHVSTVVQSSVTAFTHSRGGQTFTLPFANSVSMQRDSPRVLSLTELLFGSRFI